MIISAKGYLSSSDPAVVLPLNTEKGLQIEVVWPDHNHPVTRYLAIKGRNNVVFREK